MYMFAGASEDSGSIKYFNDMHILHCEFFAVGAGKSESHFMGFHSQSLLV